MNEAARQTEPDADTENARFCEEAARLSRSLIRMSLTLSFAGAVVAGILAGLVWRDVTVLYGFLFGAAAAAIKTLSLARGVVRLAREKRMPGAGAAFLSLLLFGTALAAAGYTSLRAFIAALSALAIPYVSVIIVSVTGRSGDRSRERAS